MDVLEVKNISVSFSHGLIFKEKREVLHHISFAVQEGELLGLAGTSGAGKSTLSRILMGLWQPDEGDVLLDGISLLGAKGRGARHQVQMLFQNPAAALHPRMTIGESMKEPLRLHGGYSREKIEEIWEDLQLRKELWPRYPSQLSGGELQRVCLGRLLLLKPRLLLLDEPTSMLDVSVQAQVISILQRLREKHPMACLFISHDLDLLRAVSDRIGILESGRLIEIAETEELYRHPKEKYTKELLRAFEEF